MSAIAVLSMMIMNVFAKTPDINCAGLPGCDTQGSDAVVVFSSNLIAELIKYVAVIAVIALMASGILYMISGGEEEKTKKAKTWILWSIVGVLLSVSAWFIVNTMNQININV